MLPPALLFAPLTQNKIRLLLSILAIALGVALGYAVQLINGAAISEFGQAVQTLSGEADLTVRGPRTGFDETLYPALATRGEVAAASPALEIDARLGGREDSLKLLGLDVFRAAAVQPGLVAQVDDTLDLLRDDAIFLTPAAATSLGLGMGDLLHFQVGLERVTFRIAGLLRHAGAGQRLAVIDIGAAQQRFNRLTLINRIDLRLRPGVSAGHVVERLRVLLPAGVYVEQPASAVQTAASLTRAYRVNLNVLALVALFTGGLLVFSAQALSVVQRRAQLALLRVLGVTRRGVVRLLIVEAALIGLAGGLIGIALGAGAARLVLDTLGPDLGAGLFRGLRPALAFEPAAAVLFVALGIGAAILGSLIPALEAGHAAPAQALKAGDDATVAARLTPVAPGVALLTLGAACAFMPPLAGLPLFGYVSIALLLIGTLALMPRLVVVLL
ncbi:MAG: ABC transporter permease, partial [Burkholderiales bacterium]